MLRLVDAHNLHLVKLVQTVQSAHILAVRACLAAETSRISAILYGQVLLVKYYVAEDVCHRNFGRRNEVEVVKIAVIHLPLLVGQLSCTIAGCLIHHIRRLYFKIPALARLVKEKRFKRPLQTCHLAYIYRETGTGDFNTEVEIYQIELLTQIPVAKSVSREFWYHATLFHHYIV